MIENGKAIICVLLPLLLVTSFASLLAVKTANASKMALEWGHLVNTEYPPDQAEVNAESWACSNINAMFPGTWSHANNYWTWTTTTIVDSMLLWIENPSNGVTWATHFWVGDFLHPDPYSPPGPWGHFACYGEGYGNFIRDNVDIYQSATYYGTRTSLQYFDFIWTCANGGTYWWDNNGCFEPTILGINEPDLSYPEEEEPPYIPSNYFPVYGYYDNYYHTGAIGMPYAWTGRTDMSLNGYTNPSGSYAYIGWENDSPFLKNTPPIGWSTTGYMYQQFPFWFYRFALGLDNGGVHGTIRQSLDYAAWKTFGYYGYPIPYTFGTSILNHGFWKYDVFEDPPNPPVDVGWYYCRMRVFGNGDLTLPY